MRSVKELLEALETDDDKHNKDLYELVEASEAVGVQKGAVLGANKERERVWAYVDDANNPNSMYTFMIDGYYLRASALREFVKSGKEWFTQKRLPFKKTLDDNKKYTE